MTAPNSPEEWKAWKQSQDHTDEVFRVTRFCTELEAILTKAQRGILAADDIAAMLTNLVADDRRFPESYEKD